MCGTRELFGHGDEISPQVGQHKFISMARNKASLGLGAMDDG